MICVFAFLKPSPKKSSAVDRAAIIVAGPVDNFQPGTVTAFVRGKFYLARLEDGGFLALSSSCTHLGCTVPWVAKENKFICPCHSSEFDIRGEVISPPAPRALDLYQIVIENNVLKVDNLKGAKANKADIEAQLRRARTDLKRSSDLLATETIADKQYTDDLAEVESLHLPLDVVT